MKVNNMIQIPYAIVKESKWYVIRCLTLPVTTQGRTEEEAIARLQEAVDLYLESTQEDVEGVQNLHCGFINVEMKKKIIA